MIKDVILQGGRVKCPICNNAFNWSYKLELVTNSELDSLDKVTTATERTPHNYITHTATDNGKVRFFISCKKCNTTIETDAMELMNENNYNSNKA